MDGKENGGKFQKVILPVGVVDVMGVESVQSDVSQVSWCACHVREALHKTKLYVVVDDGVKY